jgi:hypothetical protein
MTSRHARLDAGCLVTAAIALGIAAGCTRSPVSALERLTESRRLAADLHVQLTKAADAANRAVMAGSDDASRVSANEARQATSVVRADIDTLAPLLQGLAYTEEMRLLDEFRRRFSEYVSLDDEILGLAAENTNLKAQRLSFGAAQQAADAVRDALEPIQRSHSTDAGHLRAEVGVVLLAVREIQVLHAPHIAEADDGAMTRLEERMAQRRTAAHQTLERLAGRIRPESAPQLAAARAALERFDAVNVEIIALSRRNSNVRSLALSLGRKRRLNAACEESVQALRDALARRGFAGTR